MKKMQENRKTRYTRKALQDSLMELMKEKPISKITIKEICENADINRTTFYAHYKDQYDLLEQIENETLEWAKEKITKILESTKKSEVIKILEGIFEYFTENNNHIQVLMSEQGDIDFQKKVFTLIYEQCDMSHPNTEMQELYFIFAVNGSIGLIQRWLKNGLDKSAREMAEAIYNMAFPIPNGEKK